MEHDRPFNLPLSKQTHQPATLDNGKSRLPSSPEIAVTLTLSYQDLALLRRLLTSLDVILGQQLEEHSANKQHVTRTHPQGHMQSLVTSPTPPQDPKPGPKSRLVQRKPDQEIFSAPIRRPNTRRHIKQNEPRLSQTPPLSPVAPPPSESATPPSHVQIHDPLPTWIIDLQGTPLDISAATPIRERLWSAVVRCLAAESYLGTSPEDVSLFRRQLMQKINQYPRAKWWIDHQEQLQ